MASKRLATNVEGEFFVNSNCIDCDTCRQLAPEFYSAVGDFSAVTKQPQGDEEKRIAYRAMLSCPTGAIQSNEKSGLFEAGDDFPLLLTEGVYYCGFTSRKSYGGSSYLLLHPDGNWLIDAPRFHRPLAEKIAALGGIRYIFLTHRDDVADADKYAAYFKAERIIHELELDAQPEAEHVLTGMEPIQWHPDFKIIPLPGHTEGHTVLLYKQTYLFSGDHLAWDDDTNALNAHRNYCWYSFEEQMRSMEKLAQENFTWLLPGHGRRVMLQENEIRLEMQKLIERMKH
ncbi:MBL fold metallo-hydrolase [Tumebacillus algifaecis]|uniref:MBL fold metallo-hydrolase n=1 Tax=Tumebacillus algifaecis TaxID=1214604 RepID=A0A223CZ01_9BACL|nr:MBL fold metallo-hydrolase [Tumebacillus algifaecis]ASS74600.1 MBL fold metallo-hydrolase [Tumebacillus algifaecis]